MARYPHHPVKIHLNFEIKTQCTWIKEPCAHAEIVNLDPCELHFLPEQSEHRLKLVVLNPLVSGKGACTHPPQANRGTYNFADGDRCCCHEDPVRWQGLFSRPPLPLCSSLASKPTLDSPVISYLLVQWWLDTCTLESEQSWFSWPALASWINYRLRFNRAIRYSMIQFHLL